MEGLTFVLDSIGLVIDTFMPIFEEFHIFEIGIGIVFILGGLGLIAPILGNSILHSGSNRGGK